MYYDFSIPIEPQVPGTGRGRTSCSKTSKWRALSALATLISLISQQGGGTRVNVSCVNTVTNIVNCEVRWCAWYFGTTADPDADHIRSNLTDRLHHTSRPLTHLYSLTYVLISIDFTAELP